MTTYQQTLPNTPYRLKTLALAFSLMVMMGLAACGKKDDGQTVGQKLDSAVASTEQAIEPRPTDVTSASSTVPRPSVSTTCSPIRTRRTTAAWCPSAPSRTHDDPAECSEAESRKKTGWLTGR